MTAHSYVIGVIALLFLVTIVTRSLPFFFGQQMRNSALITRLGKQLPTCIIFLLAIYYMLAMAKPSHWHNLPWQFIALAATLLAHWRWRNMTISIFIGTAIYLILSTYL